MNKHRNTTLVVKVEEKHAYYHTFALAVTVHCAGVSVMAALGRSIITESAGNLNNMAKGKKSCCALNGKQIAAIFGLLLSVYALYVEHQAVEFPGYKAACDIESIGVSCSKVFTSKYGRMLSYFGFVEEGSELDQPNAVLGILFYSITFILPYLTFLPGWFSRLGMFLASLVSCASSAWLGYILVYVLEDICLVCVSTYVVNAIILVLSFCDLFCGKARVKTE